MEHSEFLFVTGEIGVAFTGFAGLVTVLSRRLEGPGAKHFDVTRLRFILIGSVIAVLLSLLPYVTAQFGLGSSTWVSSALVAAITIAYYAAFELIRPIVILSKDGSFGNLSKMLLGSNLIILAVSSIALLVGVFIQQEIIQTTYIATIYGLIFVVGTTLVRLFISLASPD